MATKKTAGKKTTRKKAPRKKTAKKTVRRAATRTSRSKMRAPLSPRQMACLKLVVEWGSSSGSFPIAATRIEEELRPNPIAEDLSKLVDLKLIRPPISPKGKAMPTHCEATELGIREFEAELADADDRCVDLIREAKEDITLERMYKRILMVLRADPLDVPDDEEDPRLAEIDEFDFDGVDDGSDDDDPADPDAALEDEDDEEDDVDDGV